MSDKEKFLQQAKTYIGQTGYGVCIQKLKIGFVCDWCAFSVSAIMQDCGFIGKYIKAIEGGAGTIPRYSDGKYGDWFKKGTKGPQAGDLFFMRYADYPYQDKYFCDHIGIVESVNGNTITTLEGNVDGYGSDWAGTSSFKQKTRYLTDGTVYAFYRPYWKDEEKTPSTSASAKKKSVGEIADEVIQGNCGSGDEREKKLTTAGYSYTAVQNEVNRKIKAAQKPLKSVDEIAQEVIQGKWNSGDQREKLLTDAGYDYKAVQNKVNEIMFKITIDNIAHEVIAGKWDSGEERERLLTQAGYDYHAVQNRVNQLMRK